MAADAEGMRRLGLAPDSVIGARVAECGFDIWERDDGMRPEGPDGFYDPGGALKYNDYLRDKGYDSDNPGTTMPTPASTTTAMSCRAGFWKTPTAPPTSARKTAKRPI